MVRVRTSHPKYLANFQSIQPTLKYYKTNPTLCCHLRSLQTTYSLLMNYNIRIYNDDLNQINPDHHDSNDKIYSIWWPLTNTYYNLIYSYISTHLNKYSKEKPNKGIRSYITLLSQQLSYTQLNSTNYYLCSYIYTSILNLYPYSFNLILIIKILISLISILWIFE